MKSDYTWFSVKLASSMTHTKIQGKKIRKKKVLTKFLPTFGNIKGITSKALLSSEYAH